MLRSLLLFLLILLPSCSQFSVGARIENADYIANKAHMQRDDLQAGKFKIREYKRVTNNNIANIYIEGDGFAWKSRTEISMNPTPLKPVALKLAAQDSSENVIYLGRPCQYVQDEAACSDEYWSLKRFAPEVIDSYMKILDGYKFNKTNIIGFSGGGAVATILAAKRKDIASLRTVAGNIDIKEFTKLHNVTEMEGSLNPADYAKELSAMPQIHFIGADDKVITKQISSNYLDDVGSECTKLQIVQGTTHTEGWADKWPDLLKSVSLPCID